jgi:hypothetical protein
VRFAASAAADDRTHTRCGRRHNQRTSPLIRRTVPAVGRAATSVVLQPGGMVAARDAGARGAGRHRSRRTPPHPMAVPAAGDHRPGDEIATRVFQPLPQQQPEGVAAQATLAPQRTKRRSGRRLVDHGGAIGFGSVGCAATAESLAHGDLLLPDFVIRGDDPRPWRPSDGRARTCDYRRRGSSCLPCAGRTVDCVSRTTRRHAKRDCDSPKTLATRFQQHQLIRRSPSDPGQETCLMPLRPMRSPSQGRAAGPVDRVRR